MKTVNKISIGAIVVGVIGFIVSGGQAGEIEGYITIGLTAAGTVGILYQLIKGLLEKQQ